MNIKDIGLFLSNKRKEKGLTQEEMAKKAGVGIAQMRRYEKGKSSPTLEVIKNIAKTLGVSADELIFDKKEGGPLLRYLTESCWNNLSWSQGLTLMIKMR